MTNFVRVKTENGGNATVPATFAERHQLTVLDKPAVGARNVPLAPKPPATLATSDVPGYDANTIADLKTEIEKRNAVLPEDAQIPTSGNKADLVAALEASDESQEDQ